MASKQDWVNEFIVQYVEKSGIPTDAKAIAQKEANNQEMIHGSIVDIWEPADSAANLLFKKEERFSYQ